MQLSIANAWLVLLFGAVLSAVLCMLLLPLARRVGWVDHPGFRKVHDRATPLTGGVAVFATVVVMLMASQVLAPDAATWLPQPFYLAVLLGGLALLVTGVVDDLRGLSATFRFLVQLGVCVLLIRFTGVQLDDFGSLFSAGTLQLGVLAVPITVFAALGVINAFNLIDGMDGLAALIYLVAASGMGLLALLAGHDGMAWLLLTSMAAVSGFMLLNARFPWNERARLFLGDSGSLLLGFLLAWSFIRLGSGADRAFMPITAVWLFAVPLLDTSTLIWLRWRDGRSATSADQRHLHHAFLRAGFSVRQAWLLIGLLALVLAVIGLSFELAGLPGYASFYAFMTVAFGYYFYIRHSWGSQRFLGRHFLHHEFEVEETATPQPRPVDHSGVATVTQMHALSGAAARSAATPSAATPSAATPSATAPSAATPSATAPSAATPSATASSTVGVTPLPGNAPGTVSGGVPPLSAAPAPAVTTSSIPDKRKH